MIFRFLNGFHRYLSEIFDVHLQKKHPIAITDEGDGSVEAVLRLCQAVVDSSLKTAHPLYQNQLFQVGQDQEADRPFPKWGELGSL